MNILKPILPFIILMLFCSCKENKSDKTIDFNENITNKDVAIQVTMEGKTHSILQKDVIAKEVTFENDSLQFLFQAEDNPFELNLYLNKTDIINKGKATYLIPDANKNKIIIVLDFFYAKREGKKINRRIHFRKGTINIKELSKNKLQMTFEGEGSPMMDFKNKNSFPISGKVNITY